MERKMINKCFSPKVCVITGYYNRVNAVEDTVNSILSQTFKDFEFIAFDDCSNDGTGDRLLKLQRDLNDPRFKVVINKRNKGFTQGMIDAINESSSEYICVQGSGDISMPDRIAEQVSYLDKHPGVGAVGCWYKNVISSSGIIRERRPNADDVDFEGLLNGNVFSHGEVMIRRSEYDLAGGYRSAFKNCQDYDLWLRIIKNSKLGTVKKFLYERHIRFDGVSYDPKKFSVQARYFLLAQKAARLSSVDEGFLVKKLENNGPIDLIPKNDSALQRRYIKAALRSMVFGAPNEAASLVSENVINPFLKNLLLVAIKTYGLKYFSPVRSFVHRFLGMNS